MLYHIPNLQLCNLSRREDKWEGTSVLQAALRGLHGPSLGPSPDTRQLTNGPEHSITATSVYTRGGLSWDSSTGVWPVSSSLFLLPTCGLNSLCSVRIQSKRCTRLMYLK